MRILFVSLALAAVAALAWILLAEPSGPASEPIAPVPSLSNGASGPRDGPELKLDGLQPLGERTSGVVSEGVSTAAAQAPEPEPEHPWAVQLSGVVGRVVEASGEPVAGIVVTLLEVSSDTVLATTRVALSHESIEVGSTVTGIDGRFAFEGALPASFHGIGVDLGGARATVRFVEESLSYGVVTDVGDVVMSEFGSVSGFVTDDDGEPVAGARVRLTGLPEMGVRAGFLDLHGDSVLAAPENGGFRVYEFPAWAATTLERLPVSTTYTDAEGRFLLKRVPADRVCGGVDRAGSASTIIPGFDLAVGAEHDLDELELLAGRVAMGRVVDTRGHPVAGIQVYAGAASPMIPVGFLQPGPVTDEEGRFIAPGIPELGAAMVAARRADYDAWVILEAQGSFRGLVLTLPAVSTLTVELLDATTDAPLDGADIALRSVQTAMDYGFGGMMSMVHRQHVPRPKVEPAGEGRYIVEGVADGPWTLVADVPGYGRFEASFDHVLGHGQGLHTFHVGVGDTLPYVVVDDVTGLPVPEAYVTVLTSLDGGLNALAGGWTDELGLVALGPLPSGFEGKRAVEVGVSIGPGTIVVQHPSYGRSGTRLDLEEARAATEPVEIRLHRTSTVSGRVTWAGDAPGMRYMVLLESPNESLAGLPRMSVSNAEGEFSIAGVPPGEYRLELLRRLPAGDPVQFLVSGGGNNLHQYGEQLTVVAGSDVIVSIDLDGEGAAQPGWIDGRVRLNGELVAGAEVKVGFHDPQPVFTNGDGRFRTAELSHGSCYLMVNGPQMDQRVAEDGKRVVPVNLFRGSVDVPSGRGLTVEIDVTIRTIELVVVDGHSLEPVAEAIVRCSGSSAIRTDEAGRGTLKVQVSGGFAGREVSAGMTGGWVEVNDQISIRAEGYVDQTLTESLDDLAANSPVEVALVRAVPCRGTVLLPLEATPEGGAGEVYLHLKPVGALGGSIDWIEVDAENGSFEKDGLGPGRYSASLGGLGPHPNLVEFELPEGGSTDLVIDFLGQ